MKFELSKTIFLSILSWVKKKNLFKWHHKFQKLIEHKYLLMQLSKDETMSLRKIYDFIIFFKKEKMCFSFWGPTYQKNKTKRQTCSHKNVMSIRDFVFWGRKRVKRRNKKQKLQTYFFYNNVKRQESISY